MDYKRLIVTKVTTEPSLVPTANIVSMLQAMGVNCSMG